jgi:hypothetical protein
MIFTEAQTQQTKENAATIAQIEDILSNSTKEMVPKSNFLPSCIITPFLLMIFNCLKELRLLLVTKKEKQLLCHRPLKSCKI